MKTTDILGLSVKNLLRRRTRTILAVIGVVVGTCAIVVMLSIGFGLSEGYQAQIESYGNLHLVQVNKGGGSRGTDGKPLVLDDKCVKQFSTIPGVGGATPVLSAYLYMGVGKYIAECEIIGVDPDVIKRFGYEAQEGRMLEASDKYGVVLGSDVPYQFYDPRKQKYASWSNRQTQVDVFSDKLILTADYNYGKKESMIRTEDQAEKVNYPQYKGKVIGVLSENNDMSYRSMMNLSDLKKIVQDKNKAEKSPETGNKGYDEVWIYVDQVEDVQSVSEAVKDMGFQTYSLNDWLESMKKTAAMIQGVLGGIGAISLLVAALGITNTMIMSIYERTKEIGVMKVIGANLRDISKMFLIEAGMIGFLGGCAGLLLSYLSSLAMNTVLQPFLAGLIQNMGGSGTISVIPWWVATGALIFSTCIGVLAGYYPARRAMRLSALESLRNE